MGSKKKGIVFGGNCIVDRIKIINKFPRKGTLASISSQMRSTGGAPLNNSINIKTLDPDLPVAVMGKIGDDPDGSFIIETLQARGIDTSGITTSSSSATSYTDVYTEENGGVRTFFHYRGANAEWGIKDIDITMFENYRIAHFGYILLMDQMDSHNEEYGTELSQVLAAVRDMGVKTAVDVVTDLSGQFQYTVVPALKHTDYLVLNEIEAGETAEIQVRNDRDEIIKENIKEAAERLMAFGGNTEVVVIHMPEGACGMSIEKKNPVWIDSFKVSEKDIVNTVGAGDAFASGVLYALHESKSLEEAIRFAHGMAARCLYAATATGGAAGFSDVITFIKKQMK